MKTIIKIIGIIATIAVITASCNKVDGLLETDIFETETQNTTIKKTAILSFDNSSSLDVALHEILSLKQEERVVKNATIGFKSFATITQELYETIDPDRFQNLEEIKAFVEKRSKYLQLIPEKHGEYTLEVVAYRNPYSYLANENGEIKIGGSICKITEESVIDVKTGLTVAFSPFNKPVSEGDIMAKNTIVLEKDVSETHDHRIVLTNRQLIGSNPFYATPTTGSDRLAFEIQNVASKGQMSNTAWIITHFFLRAYNKTLGVWFWSNRALNLTVEYNGVMQIGGLINYPFSRSDANVLAGESGGLTAWIDLQIPNAPWSNFDVQFITNSYRFRAWTSKNSREWRYQP